MNNIQFRETYLGRRTFSWQRKALNWLRRPLFEVTAKLRLIMILLPARKVPMRHNGLSGYFPSVKNGREMAFESPLERQFMLLLEFDPSIYRYTEQPVTIPYTKAEYKGGAREPGYTPDLLIYYRQHHFTEPRWPDLVEVKPEKEFKKLEIENTDKYAAADQYARLQSWHFLKWSELLIHPRRLANANDFYRALGAPRYLESEAQIIEYMAANESVQGSDIVLHFGKKPEIVSAFRYLVASKRLHTDWEQPISLTSTFELVEVPYDD